jgi:Glycosyltransferase family 17
MKVYDCFPFFNELDLLEIRLNELYDVVDYFVIIEGERTHQNGEKPLYYAENKDRFAKFHDKIINVVIDASQFNGDRVHNESISFDAMMNVMEHINASEEDFVLVGCADEIIRAEALRKLVDSYKELTIIETDNFCYYLNTQFAESATHWWAGPLAKIKDLRKFGGKIKRCIEITRSNSSLRSSQAIDVPLPHGWHFTFIGNKKDLKSKVSSYIHSEFNHLTEDEFQTSIDNLSDPLSRTGTMSFKFIGMYPIEQLPKYVQDNLDKFDHLLKK